MHLRDDRMMLKRQEYENFCEDLATKPGAIESGLMIFLTMLFIIPLVGFIGVTMIGVLCDFCLSNVLLFSGLVGASGLAMVQAYRGLVRRRVRIFPRSRVRNEAAYIGGKTKEVVTGQEARVAGALFFGIGLAALAGALWSLIDLLRIVAANG